MAKPKAFTKQAKTKCNKPKKEPKLDTVDDFQATGVEYEEAAGKWRAGDPVKSLRFFQRALDVYNQGLQNFPQSIDLAYNRARVQLEMATCDILVSHLQEPLNDLLEVALESHRYALKLDPDNAETLFNTAQVLTSIAELLAENDNDAQALKNLREALDLQNMCFVIQEKSYQEYLDNERQAKQQIESMDTPENPEEVDDTEESQAGGSDHEEQWINTVEAVTEDTLIDTVIAQLGSLTTLCSILSQSPEVAQPDTLAWVEGLSSNVIERVQQFSQEKPERLQELALAKADLVTNMMEAGYRSGRVSAETYNSERDAAFAVPELKLESSAEALIANACSMMSFNAALAEVSGGDPKTHSVVRWNVLTACISNLKAAGGIQGIDQDVIATTHLLRGDASLFLFTMAIPPTTHDSAMKNATQNAKNAEVYYRNASKLFSDAEAKDVASLRSIVAQYAREYATTGQYDVAAVIKASTRRDQEWTMEQLMDIVSEGLIPEQLISS